MSKRINVGTKVKILKYNSYYSEQGGVLVCDYDERRGNTGVVTHKWKHSTGTPTLYTVRLDHPNIGSFDDITGDCLEAL